MIKLNEDEKDLIRGMMIGNEWKVVEKVCAMIVEQLQLDLVNTSVEDSSRKITLRKAKLDGARDVAKFVNNIKARLSKEGLE
jgi:hypothetical protein